MSPLPNSPPAGEPPPFPLRVAAIDVGSNAMRLAAAEFTARKTYRPLRSLREPVRLGADAFHAGRLGDAVMERAVAAMTRFRETMDELGVSAHRAVATSAVRDSGNGAELIARVWDACRIRIETITGGEEARLVWLAVRERVAPGEGDRVLVDLGGGSVEISLVSGGELLWSESHPLGTVRLLEELGDVDGESPPRVRRRLEEHAAMARIADIARHVEPAGLIATGGNMEELARLTGSRPDAAGVSHVRLETLAAAIDRLAELSPGERVRELGLRPDRADVILPAALVYERIARLFGAHRIVVPNVGVKDGLLLDTVDDLLERGAREGGPEPAR